MKAAPALRSTQSTTWRKSREKGNSARAFWECPELQNVRSLRADHRGVDVSTRMWLVVSRRGLARRELRTEGSVLRPADWKSAIRQVGNPRYSGSARADFGSAGISRPVCGGHPTAANEVIGYTRESPAISILEAPASGIEILSACSFGFQRLHSIRRGTFIAIKNAGASRFAIR